LVDKGRVRSSCSDPNNAVGERRKPPAAAPL